MPISDYTPNVSEVAAILWARTRDAEGTLVGTFNSNTEPTDTQVVNMITEAVNEISASAGTDLPGELIIKLAKRVVILLAAMNVELSYFPEQVQTANSPYEALERRFNASLKRLLTEISEAGGGTAPGDSAGVISQYPSGGFPEVDSYMGRRW